MARILIYRSESVAPQGFNGVAIDWFKVPGSSNTYLSLSLDSDIRKNPHIGKICEIPERYSNAIALKLVRYRFRLYLRIDYWCNDRILFDLIGQHHPVDTPISLASTKSA